MFILPPTEPRHLDCATVGDGGGVKGGGGERLISTPIIVLSIHNTLY